MQRRGEIDCVRAGLLFWLAGTVIFVIACFVVLTLIWLLCCKYCIVVIGLCVLDLLGYDCDYCVVVTVL